MQLRDPRDVIAHLFSRGVLGSMLVGTGIGKVVEKLVILSTPNSTLAAMLGWMAASIIFIVLYVYWADFEAAASDAADSAADAVGGDADD